MRSIFKLTLSLGLVFITYFSLGWLVYKSLPNWHLGLLYSLGIIILTLSITAPANSIKNGIVLLIGSDIRAFLALMIGAFGVVAIFVWIDIMSNIFMGVAATILGRLDLQQAELSDIKSFIILSITSIAGLFVGGYLKYFLLAKQIIT